MLCLSFILLFKIVFVVYLQQIWHSFVLNVRFSLTTEVKHLTTNTWHHYSKRLQLKWWQTGVLWPLSRLWAFPVFWIKITSEGNKKSAEHRSFYRYIPLWYDKNLLLTFKLELNYYLTDYLFTKNDSFFPTKFQSLVVLWFFFFPSTVFPYSFCKSSGVLMNIISSGSSAT